MVSFPECLRKQSEVAEPSAIRFLAVKPWPCLGTTGWLSLYLYDWGPTYTRHVSGLRLHTQHMNYMDQQSVNAEFCAGRLCWKNKLSLCGNNSQLMTVLLVCCKQPRWRRCRRQLELSTLGYYVSRGHGRVLLLLQQHTEQLTLLWVHLLWVHNENVPPCEIF